jgi:quinolinate synthase
VKKIHFFFTFFWTFLKGGLRCENMKLHTIEEVKNCLLNGEFAVKVDEKVAN